MVEKILLVVVIALVVTGLLVGCSSDSVKGKDLLRDKAAIKEMVKQMKEKGGTPLMLF